ncbi:hypothetical protein V2J09_013324 [Rumex salicifolius]
MKKHSSSPPLLAPPRSFRDALLPTFPVEALNSFLQLQTLGKISSPLSCFTFLSLHSLLSHCLLLSSSVFTVKQALGSDCRDQRSTKSKKKWFVKKKKKSVQPISIPSTATDNTSSTTAAATTPMPPPPPPAVGVVAAPQSSPVDEIKQPPVIPIPIPKEEDVKRKEEIEEEEDEQRKHAQSIAIATAKAAEAAAAAAQAAAEVVRLTNAAPSPKKPKEEEPKEEVAALRIQTAFRAYLARRALCALRGLASLNIVMQVKFVKPQSTNTLKSMQSLVHMQSQVRSRRLRMSEGSQVWPGMTFEKQVKELEKVENLLQNGNDWNSSPKSKEQTDARLQSQHKATMRRERALAYSLNHQKTWKNSPTSKSAQTMSTDMKNRHSGWSWLERWLAARPWETANSTDLASPQEKQTSGSSSPTSSPKASQKRGTSTGRLSTSKARVSPLKPKPTSPKASPRRSFCCPEEDAKSTLSGQSGSSGEEEMLPSYMAPTESARAKTDRLSVSSAKNRASSPARSRRSVSSITDANSVAEHQTLINAILLVAGVVVQSELPLLCSRTLVLTASGESFGLAVLWCSGVVGRRGVSLCNRVGACSLPFALGCVVCPVVPPVPVPRGPLLCCAQVCCRLLLAAFVCCVRWLGEVAWCGEVASFQRRI